jgi:hypothetical protein
MYALPTELAKIRAFCEGEPRGNSLIRMIYKHHPCLVFQFFKRFLQRWIGMDYLIGKKGTQYVKKDVHCSQSPR